MRKMDTFRSHPPANNLHSQIITARIHLQYMEFKVFLVKETKSSADLRNEDTFAKPCDLISKGSLYAHWDFKCLILLVKMENLKARCVAPTNVI